MFCKGTGKYNKLVKVAADPTASLDDHVNPTYLSASFYGSSKWYQSSFHNAIQNCVEHGSPTIFLTFTTCVHPTVPN